MKFNQIIKVLMENGEVKEFKEGYITFTYLTPWNHNCTCDLDDNEECLNDDCYEDFEFNITAFYDKNMNFQGICVNNESKDNLELIGRFMHDIPGTCEDAYPLLKVCYYEGIVYTIDLSDEDKSQLEDAISENISDEFINVFNEHKKSLLENHIEDFESYYIDIFHDPFKNLRKEIYDFSTESAMLYEHLGKRHPNKSEYEYLSSSLRDIVAGYIEHKALGY